MFKKRKIKENEQKEKIIEKHIIKNKIQQTKQRKHIFFKLSQK